jgi:hypothetical protein
LVTRTRDFTASMAAEGKSFATRSRAHARAWREKALFTGLANSLRSLTASPIGTLVDQAHRMARRRLESGGAAISKRSRGDDDDKEAEFVLPSDIDPAEVALAIHAKLDADRGAQAGLGDDLLHVLERRAGGRVVVPAHHVLRIGDGRFDLGRRFLHGIIGQIRARRRGLRS